MKAKHKNFRHTLIVTIIAIGIAGIILILYPQHKNFSGIATGFAVTHLILLIVAVFTGWIITPQKFWDSIFKKKKVEGYDFGWSPKWRYGFLIASIITFMLAVFTYFKLNGNPHIQLIVYTVLLLLAINFLLGNITVRHSGRTVKITLPMVNLLANGGEKVLDAGCGSGRTTIAVAEAFPQAKITALDKFDAGYIEEGGMKLFQQNINLAGIENRVNIVSGDITGTPFENSQFDAVVSSFMIDHLQDGKQQALKEAYRIMKPGGRFLLVIIVKGFSSFTIANVLSLMLTSRKKWIQWIEQTGFKMLSNGLINEGGYFFFEKPSE